MKKVKAIILDKDGVFVDFKKLWGRVIPQRAQVIAETALSAWTLFGDIRESMIRVMGIDPDTEEIDPFSPGSSLPFEKVKVALATALFMKLKSELPDFGWKEAFACVEKAVKETDKVIDFVGLSEPVSGTIEKIREFKNAGYKLAVLTADKQENAIGALDKFGIADCFDEISAAHTKTAELYKSLCEKLGVAPEETLMFGDTVNELKEAQRAGAYTIGVLSGAINKKHEDLFSECTDMVLDSLADFDIAHLNEPEDDHIKHLDAPRGLKARSSKGSQSSEELELYSDGACRGNPGEASIGAVLISDGREIETVSEVIGVTTNNVAEYKALIAGLGQAIDLGFKRVIAHADSELMIKQLNGEYKVKNENMKPLFLEVKRLEKEFEHVEYKHVPRDKNKRADKLANLALDRIQV